MKKKIKVNLGCGSWIVPSTKDSDWINLDNYVLFSGEKNKKFVQGDVRKLPLASESVDYIFCDQVLEHIPMKDVPAVLYEVRRVLKKGGTAIIIVPDFKACVKQWLEILDGGHSFDPVTYNYFSEVIYGNQHHEGEYHKTAMTADYLFYVLNMVGLVNNKISVFPAFSAIPNYDGIRPHPANALYRNGQLVVDIIKE